MIAHLRKAVEMGVTFFDTAEVYGPTAVRSWSEKLWSLSKDKLPLPLNLGLRSEQARVGRNATPASIKR